MAFAHASAVTVSHTSDTARRIRAIVAGSSGNLVEWFDFYVYAFTALYFASQFFPTGNQTTQLLNAAGVFAAGFLMRPSVSGVVKAELFPMHVRALGVGLPYALANAAFGGTAEYVALWFKSIGEEASFFWYVTVFACVSLVAAILMPDTRRLGHMTAEEERYLQP